MRIVGDYLSHHNLYDECYEDGLFCWYFGIVSCWSIEIPNIKYQMSGIGRDGWIMIKDLEKKTRSLSLSLPSPSLPVCVRICTYVGRYSFPSNLTFTFTFTFTYTKLNHSLFNHQVGTLPYLTEPYATFTQNRIFPSSHPIHTSTYVLYCTVSTICRQYLRYLMYAFANFSPRAIQ